MATSHRPGGYYLVRGIPLDAEGRPIPEAEWLDADYERIKGEPRSREPEPAPAKRYSK